MDNIIKEAQAPETPTFETLPKYVGEIPEPSQQN